MQNRKREGTVSSSLSSTKEYRDVSGQLVRPAERKRVTLAIGDRTIKASPSGPAKTPQISSYVKPVKKAVSIYAVPTKTHPQSLSLPYRNKVDNGSARREKYRTQFDGEYVNRANTGQYRERDKIHQLGQYPISH